MSKEIVKATHSERSQLVFIGVVTTFLSLIPTAYAALVSNSVTLLSDFLRCAAEFCAIFISWLVLKKISREDQVTYNYGFGKLEQVASISVAMALFVTFIVSLFASINRFISPQILENTSFGLSFAILSVIGNSFLWMKNYKLHKTSPSPVSDSQWRLFRAKTCATVVVALSLASSLIFEQVKVGLYFDPLGSLLLSLFLFHSSYTIVSNSMSDLVDRAVDEQVQFIVVRNLIKHEKEYMGLEAVRSRRSGNRMFIDIFLSFSPTSSFDDVCLAAARISSDMERQLPGTEICVIPRPFF